MFDSQKVPADVPARAAKEETTVRQENKKWDCPLLTGRGSKLNFLGFPGKQSKSAGHTTHESPKESPFQLSNKQINTMFSLNVLSTTQYIRE